MNPAVLFRLKGDLKRLAAAHPKFAAFVHYAADHSIQPGSVLDITIRQPDGKTVHSNLRLTDDDVQTLQTFLSLLRDKG